MFTSRPHQASLACRQQLTFLLAATPDQLAAVLALPPALASTGATSTSPYSSVGQGSTATPSHSRVLSSEQLAAALGSMPAGGSSTLTALRQYQASDLSTSIVGRMRMPGQTDAQQL